MPRIKGQKNTKNEARTSTIIEAQIGDTEDRIEELTKAIAVEKKKLKDLKKELAKKAKQEEKERKAAEQKELLKAIGSSTKSVDEILDFLNN